jgi:hypothetical protein
VLQQDLANNVMDQNETSGQLKQLASHVGYCSQPICRMPDRTRR